MEPAAAARGSSLEMLEAPMTEPKRPPAPKPDCGGVEGGAGAARERGREGGMIGEG